MHVLGTPPAFILSQDQTLHRNCRGLLSSTILLDRRFPTTLRLLRCRPTAPPRLARCRGADCQYTGPEGSPSRVLGMLRGTKNPSPSRRLGIPDSCPKRLRCRSIPRDCLQPRPCAVRLYPGGDPPCHQDFLSARSGARPRDIYYGNRSVRGLSRPFRLAGPSRSAPAAPHRRGSPECTASLMEPATSR